MPPLTFANYLDLEKLLTLQNPRSTPAEHDEMLFIISIRPTSFGLSTCSTSSRKSKKDFSAGDLAGSSHRPLTGTVLNRVLF